MQVIEICLVIFDRDFKLLCDQLSHIGLVSEMMKIFSFVLIKILAKNTSHFENVIQSSMHN